MKYSDSEGNIHIISDNGKQEHIFHKDKERVLIVICSPDESKIYKQILDLINSEFSCISYKISTNLNGFGDNMVVVKRI